MNTPSPTTRIIALNPTDAEDFEQAAERAKSIGASHVLITEDLPKSFWQMEQSNDPYPAWFIHQPGLLKIFPPKLLQAYVDLDYAERIAQILEDRCTVLQRLGMKAYYFCNEPQVLPEPFFRSHPHLRGPRVDQSNRSRQPHFSPCTDRPEVLQMYRESIQALLKRCPEVELFSFVTTDSGAGFCWSPALYPGRNGPAHCEHRDMSERVAGFLINLQTAAQERGRTIEINIVEIPARRWMRPTFLDAKAIARKLPPGLSVNNHEGPEGKAFMNGTGMENLWSNCFYPVLGIPRPMAFLRTLVQATKHPGRRKVLAFNDAVNNELNFTIAEAFDRLTPRDRIAQLQLLREVALQQVGEAQADKLLELWHIVDEVEVLLEPLDFGPVLRMGCILARWINRPFVPFPEELSEADSYYWRNFLFQAKGDEQALNLIDIQAMRMFEGWGARMLVEQTVEQIFLRLREALALAAETGQKELERRLKILRCLLINTRNAVSYQAQLERVKNAGILPDPNPVLGTRSSWDRDDLLRIAREEIDNCVELIDLLKTGEGRALDTAQHSDEEAITQLGPDLVQQLQHKITTMNAHWCDYGRLLTEPNP
ncbi:MAG: hypothetical protein JJU20_00090 [Opitutales bacterium]|nr:hypothetical protein [Opitutales bacterium]